MVASSPATIASQLLNESARQTPCRLDERSQVARRHPAAEMVAQDIQPRGVVGHWNFNVKVKTPGSQEGGVDQLRMIGRTDNDDTFSCIRPVKAFKQGVHNLPLVVMVVRIHPLLAISN